MTTPPPAAPAFDGDALVSPEAMAAAWGAWHARHGGKLGPGPAFREALAAGGAVIATPLLAEIEALRGGLKACLSGAVAHRDAAETRIADLTRERDEARAASAERKGYVLVPREPTDAMIAAAEAECRRMRGVIDPVLHVWDAMIKVVDDGPAAPAERDEMRCDGWQPISSYPNDTWPRLVWGPLLGQSVAYRGPKGDWLSMPAAHPLHAPTHWRSLPLAPHPDECDQVPGSEQPPGVEDMLAAACKPWQYHVGPPPSDDSPLSAVFGAGMAYTEALLAQRLGVDRYEGGDGSESFDGDATQTLVNILAAAGLYDAETGELARLRTAPRVGEEGEYRD